MAKVKITSHGTRAALLTIVALLEGVYPRERLSSPDEQATVQWLRETTPPPPRHEIVCETCDAPSGMTGKVLIAKWSKRSWYCKEHDPIQHRRDLKPLCTCGHRKTHHASAKNRCCIATHNTGRRAYQMRVDVRIRNHPDEKSYWTYCKCTKYVPSDKY